MAENAAPDIEAMIRRHMKASYEKGHASSEHPWDDVIATGEALRTALVAGAKAVEEVKSAAALLAKRYPSPEPIPSLIGRFFRDHADVCETVNRLRGECKFDDELARHMRIIDHEQYVSRGQMSDMLDFAQGQKRLANKAEARVLELEADNERKDEALRAGQHALAHVGGFFAKDTTSRIIVAAQTKIAAALAKKEPAHE
jgi:hypothetical protein